MQTYTKGSQVIREENKGEREKKRPMKTNSKQQNDNINIHMDKHVKYKWTAAAAKSFQLCPSLCDPTDGSTPGSSVPGILQARTQEWVAISFSNA